MNRSRIQRPGRIVNSWTVIFLLITSLFLPLLSVQTDPVLAKPLAEVLPSETRSNPLNPNQAFFNDRQPATSPESFLFLGNPDSTVTLAILGSTFIGQNVNFTATFNNAGALTDDTGYAPFIDLYLPTTGADGDGDGLGNTLITASYLSTSITPLVLTFPAGGTVDHPYSYQGPTDPSPGSPLVITGTPGDKLAVIPLPFGSFTRDQPAVTIDVTVDMSSFANVGEALIIRARGGYRYGGTAINDWCCLEGTLVFPPGNTPITDWTGYPVTPTIMETNKAYNGPEGEIPTGPNFDGIFGTFGSYTITTNVAPGQTVTNLTITDTLPNDIAYTNLTGSSGADTGTGTAVLGAPGGTINWNFGSVSGTATLTVDFFVPLNNASANPVLNASTGADGSATNSVSVSASWTPTDGDDPAGPITGSCPSCSPIISLESISTQKSVSDPIPTVDVNEPGHTPGDTLTYTINFQVSDFFAFENLIVTDILNDGQCFIPGSAQITINEHSGENFGPVSIIPTNITGTDTTAPVCADTTLTFDVSAAMTTASGNGQLLGGCIPSGGTAGPTPDCSLFNGGATNGTITFTAIIQEDYSAAPSGDTSVDHNDTIGNNVSIAGNVINVNTLVATGNSEDDGSTSSIRIIQGALTKSIYGYNTGSGCILGSPGSNPLSPGDEITYRLVYPLPSSDTEYLHFTDYLPLPVLDADELTSPFNTTVSGACPAAGTAKFGPTDTFFATSAITPGITIDSNANSVTFDYGPEYDGDATGLSTVDILFTVTISDDPFADQLLLTNQARVSESNSFNDVTTGDGIIQFVLGEPVLTSTKSVIAHSSSDPIVSFTGTSPSPVFSLPGSANPRWAGQIAAADIGDADITGLDGSDWASFALMVTNSGSSPLGAFDITISDTLMAPDFVIPTIANLNLSVTYADGTAVPFTSVAVPADCTGSGDETDPCGPDGTADTDDDIFGYGLEIIDTGPADGACQEAGHASGHDLIIITYDLQINPAISPQTVITNTGSLNSYAGSEGGPNHLSAPDTDTSTVTVAVPGVTKILVNPTGIIEANNDNDEVVIGETIQYKVELTIPEGRMLLANLIDDLEEGLRFVSLDSLVISTPATPQLNSSEDTSLAQDFSNTADFNPTDGGATGAVGDPQTLTFDFGTLTNTNLDDLALETITLTYTVLVLNVTTSRHADVLTNAAYLEWDEDGDAGTAGNVQTVPVGADVIVVEPQINVTKSVQVGGPSPPNPLNTSGDAGDLVEYEIIITADPNRPTVYEAVLSDFLSSDIDFSGGTITVVDTELIDAQFEIGPGNELRLLPPTVYIDMVPGRQITITVTGVLEDTVYTGQNLYNNAVMTWTDISGTNGNTSGDIDGERTGQDGAGGLNDYENTGTALIDITEPAPQKTVILTSETHTGTGGDGRPRVVIGEIVRYRIEIRLAEGTSNDVILWDELPDGLMFLNDNTAKVIFVSSFLGNIDSDTTTPPTLPTVVYGIDDGTAFTTGDQSTVAGITPVYSLPDNNVSSSLSANIDTYNSGGDVYFKLGDILNTEVDSNLEFAVVEFNALTTNVGSNNSGVELANRFNVMVDIDGDQDTETGEIVETSSNEYITVAEPVLTINKSNTTGSAIIDAGDAVQYTLVITNTSSGDDAAMAYDLNIVDTLDANLILTNEATDIALSFSGTASPYDVSASNDGGGGDDEINLTIDFLAPGETATIVVDLVLADDAVIALVVNNESTVTYTSLEGDYGNTGNATGSDTSGTPGDIDGERTGSGGVVNDYTDTSPNVQFTLSDPAVLKTVTNSSALHTTSLQGNPAIPDLVIGETVTFQLTATIPEGYAAPTTITDNLPLAPGRLSVISHCVVSVGNSLSGASLPAIPTCPTSFGTASDTVADANNYNDQVVFSFGNVQNTPDGVSNADDQITVQVVALLLNHVDNQSPDTLTNTARVDAGSGSDIDTTEVEIVESNLTINKTSTVVTPVSGTAILGSTIEYTLALGNPSVSSSAAAYDMVLTDSIPTGMTYVAASITAPAGWTADDSAAPLLTWTSNAGTGLALDGTASFSYRATIDGVGMPNEPTPGDILTNAVNLAWTSLNGGPIGLERNGADGPGGALDDYANSTDDDVTVENIDLRIEKDDRGATFSAGDTLVYDLRYYNDGSIDATGVVITETVPVNTTFDLAGSSGAWSCPDNSPAGTTCTQSLGTISPGGPTIVQFAVTIDNPLPAGVTTITNTVSIADDGSNGPEPTPGNNNASIVTPSIAASPDLTITKDDSLEIVAPGAHMVYRLDYANVGTQDATGVVITETVSAGVTFDLGNSTAGWVVQGTGVPAVDGEVAGTVLEFVVGNVNAGDAAVTVNFAVVVDNPLAPGITAITNTASIADDGTNGLDLTPADNSDDDTDQVADSITKTMTVSNVLDSTDPEVAIGEILTYEIVLTIPQGTMTNVEVVDDLDLGLAFLGCVSITPQSGNLTTTLAGGFSDACDNAVAPPGDPTTGNPAIFPLPLGSIVSAEQGRRILFDLDSVTNSGASLQTLTITLEVVVLDNAANQSGVDLNNDVIWSWDNDSELNASASDVTIIEADLTLNKDAFPTRVYLNQTITFTITVQHTGISETPAYDLVLTDIIPSELNYVTGSLRLVSGLSPDLPLDDTGPDLIVTWTTFDETDISTIAFDVVFSPSFRRNNHRQTITNDASLSWTSLPDGNSGPPPLIQSAFNLLSTERYYDPLSNINVYAVSDGATIIIPKLPDTGFAPGRVTDLPVQNADQLYSDMDNLQLEIPALDLTLPIVSVPQSDQGWDLTWLWDQAGWLEGTAYPSWIGNTVITGHAYLSTGLPGPFVNLASLGWGDEIILYANGLKYTYQVRLRELVASDDHSILDHKEGDWITLFTCRDYNETLDEYNWRQVVQAALIDVEQIE